MPYKASSFYTFCKAFSMERGRGVCILVNDVRPKTNEIKKLFDKLE